MEGLQSFIFEGQEVRTVVKDGEGWFVAKDVSDILGFRDAYTATRSLDSDEKAITQMCVAGQNRDITIINESGLYALIFKSKKKEARAFRKWVTSEVLPTIRKDGGYISSDITDEQADKLDKKLLLSTPQRRRKQLEEATIDGKENVFTVYEDIKEYIKNWKADDKVTALRHVERVLDDKKEGYGTDIAFVVKIEELLVGVAKDIDKIRNHSYGARLREINKQHKELQEEYQSIKPPAIDKYHAINYHPFSINSS
ncbi:BRO-N domain-containing protein [Pseudogracilibacillus sp. SO30301A]|uniref:BRO-N domain-containing protein n=1 Tax=Pseudogracilibacillus sp. SO30301A TaxID=3098291 RepID=UPI00300E088B